MNLAPLPFSLSKEAVKIIGMRNILTHDYPETDTNNMENG